MQNRPRLITLILSIVIAALIVLANFSVDISDGADAGILYLSYGWPLVWRRYVLLNDTVAWQIFDWQWSTARLAGDTAVWLMLLAVPGLACEWASRRYQLRLRWRLRSMLAAVGLAAAACGWFVAIRDRANLQDSLITDIEGHGGIVAVERWGPKWLDLVRCDRFRRYIVAVRLPLTEDAVGEASPDAENDELLTQVSDLKTLRYLDLEFDRWNPVVSEALRNLRQVRSLTIEQREPIWEDNDCRVSRECLTIIGGLTELKRLELKGLTIRSDTLALLEGLTNLKSLTLNVMAIGDPPVLRSMPMLPRLEVFEPVCFAGGPFERAHFAVEDDDLPYLAALPKIKALGLAFTDVTDMRLAELASSNSLEELDISPKMETANGLESLLALKRLRTLHLGHRDGNADQETLAGPRDREALRRSRPELIIDTDGSNPGRLHNFVPLWWEYDARPERPDMLRGLKWFTPATRKRYKAWIVRKGISVSF